MAGIDALIDQPVIEAIGWALLHFVWQGALVGLLAAAALRLLRGSAADVRYVIGAVALSLMATLPVVTGVQAYRTSQGDSDGTTTYVASPIPDPASVPAGAASTDRESPAIVLDPTGVSMPTLERWMPMFVLGWMMGVAILAVRLVGGWVWMQRIKSHGAVPADDALQAVVRRLSRRLHIDRTITLLRSPGVDVPTVIGWLKPTVLLPMSALSGLTPLQIEAILAHELAHVRRHDYSVNLLQTLLETLLFYHPAVWWVSRQIRTERENCCDDLAVSLCGDPVIYASALADLEELRGPASPLVMAASGGVLLDRVRRLLTGPAPHAGRGPAWAASSAALLMLIVVGGAVGRHSLKAEATRDRTPAAAAPEPPAQSVVPESKPVDVSQPAPEIPLAPATPANPPPSAEAVRSDVSATPTAISALTDLAPATTLALGTTQAPPAPPAPPSRPSPPSPPAASGVSEERQSSSGNFVWQNGNDDVIAVKYDGTFEVTDDDLGIKSLTPGGFVYISDGQRGRHEVRFTADRAGQITTRYLVDGREHAFEPEGRQWLASVMPRFVRRSGFAAKSRVARYLRNGGPQAVLAEISNIEGSYAKRVYFSELMKQSPLDAGTARRLLEQAGRQIESDYELASLLISASDKLLTDAPQEYFDAARSIQSDYELRRVLGESLKRGGDSRLTSRLLEAGRSLQSDYEAASLLQQLLKQQGIENTRDQFFSMVGTLDSAYEKGRVLQALLRRDDISNDTLLAALAAAGTIGSGYEASQVLQAAARAHTINGAARETYLKVADRLGNYEQSRALAALNRNERR